jgi:hypothetical protein
VPSPLSVIVPIAWPSAASFTELPGTRLPFASSTVTFAVDFDVPAFVVEVSMAV